MTIHNKIAARFTDLPARTISVLIAAPLVLLAVWTGGIFYQGLVGGVIILGMYEWLRLHQPTPSILCEGISQIGLLVVWWLCHIGYYGIACCTLTAIAAFSYMLYERANLENRAWVAFGLPYLGGAMIALMSLEEDWGFTFSDIQGDSRLTVLFLLLTVWAADTGAYAGGRIIGGPKLAPVISPSKTWAGFICAILSAMLIGFGFINFVPQVAGKGLPVLAAFMGIGAQLGDMFESYAKRKVGVKDSGNLLPGHGGILDRIDGLIAAAIMLALWRFALGIWSAI